MSIFEPTVALATWDEDGMHEENGMQIMHKKGDYKTNENGDYFYEVLGSRESYNKEILRATDVLTTDGSTLNKFDFMDSDGLTKSVGSVVGKTFMQIAPLLIPGVREVYGTISAITTLTSVLPVELISFLIAIIDVLISFTLLLFTSGIPAIISPHNNSHQSNHGFLFCNKS
jgi:hypothetical protein